MISTARNYLKFAVDIIYPTYCGGCGSKGNVLCEACLASFKTHEEENACPVCGRILSQPIVCGECMEGKRGFAEGFFGFTYENRLRDAVHAFKFQGRKDVGRQLIRFLEEKIRGISERFDTIVPIPVTEKRLKQRGYNQSFIISEEISRISGRPVIPDVLHKTRETKDQYSLHRKERKGNVRGAFAAKNTDPVKRRSVLLVDDLFTTGYTAKEASRVLLRAGAGRVIFFALARTP